MYYILRRLYIGFLWILLIWLWKLWTDDQIYLIIGALITILQILNILPLSIYQQKYQELIKIFYLFINFFVAGLSFYYYNVKSDAMLLWLAIMLYFAGIFYIHKIKYHTNVLDF